MTLILEIALGIVVGYVLLVILGVAIQGVGAWMDSLWGSIEDFLEGILGLIGNALGAANAHAL